MRDVKPDLKIVNAKDEPDYSRTARFSTSSGMVLTELGMLADPASMGISNYSSLIAITSRLLYSQPEKHT